MEKQYAERDLRELDKAGGYYTRHVAAMTAEGLHSKSDIAAELAWRDVEIDRLKRQAAGVPDGWKLVPVEPAWEMLNACAADWQARGMFGLDTLDARAAYSAMLAAAPEAQQADIVLDKICDVLKIGKFWHTESTILENVKNAARRSQCLSGIERKFFTTVYEDDEGDTVEDCALNWGDEPSEYVERFGEALRVLIEQQKQTASVPDGWKFVPAEIIDRFPEINPSNYDHDDVCNLNAWGVELVLAAAPEAPKS